MIKLSVEPAVMNESQTPSTCAVQSKIPCVLKTIVKELPSSKRRGQNYTVEAANELSEQALQCDFQSALATEKLDGTCCLVRCHKGKPVLWARLDRKPNKPAGKRFKAYQRKHREWQIKKLGEEPKFEWKFSSDLKTVSEDWIPADHVTIDRTSNCPVPDENGHVPGWIPVNGENAQYCWHSMTVDYDESIALTLTSAIDDTNNSTMMGFKKTNIYKVSPTPLSELNEKTLELIGTNINGNPYNLGSKSHPFHVLIKHGCLLIDNLPEKLTYKSLFDWFKSETHPVEGIVWHFPNGNMFKIHRHHLSLPWPLKGDCNESAVEQQQPSLCCKPVQFTMDGISGEKYSALPTKSESMFHTVNSLCDKTFLNFFELFNTSNKHE